MRFIREADPFPQVPRPTSSLCVHVAAKSDVGRHRQNNEDSVLVADLARDALRTERSVSETWELVPGRFVCAVLDGMGGEAGGEVASRLGTEALFVAMRERPTLGANPALLAAELKASVQAASDRIARIAREQPEYARMGTTATVASVAGDTLVVAQVGDSRAYLFRGGVLSPLTRDQTLSRMLVESGQLTPEEAERFDGGHIILQALGSSPKLDVAITTTRLEKDDLVLLCSDGLTGPLDDAEIGRILARAETPERACELLVSRANEEGGPDNVTCVVLRFGGSALGRTRAT
jgi:protein phosphatase